MVGYRISNEIKGRDKDNVKKIGDAKRPQTKKEVKALLLLTGYYCEFVPNYAEKTVPLSDLTKKGQSRKVRWKVAQERAYSTLKSEMTISPILCLPNKTKPFTLRTYTSDVGIGAVLLQGHGGKLSPVSCAKNLLENSPVMSRSTAPSKGNVFNCYRLGREEVPDITV